ncbi:hypothetical protein [Pseudaminobacter salicylatoxidans]|uniref:hypothetical protein n=1 Tax=Pseudaminobacter salicylatoxidans TaxID=93369 RepID=UPI0002F28ED5|nr:hypothetical protein [Pseudaminobacter salicylatoxidans]
MKFRSIDSRVVVGLALSSLMIIVAGCQSSGGGADSAAKPKVAESELRAYCPNVTLREGTAFFSTYAKGGQDDASKLVYQASIAQVTRACSRADGMLTLNVAIAGKVVPGPEGAPGKMTMPIRVVAVQGMDQKVLYSKLHKFEVTVSDTSTATQFVFNDPAVTFPIPAEQNVQLYAGFDEGPPAKGK